MVLLIGQGTRRLTGMFQAPFKKSKKYGPIPITTSGGIE